MYINFKSNRGSTMIIFALLLTTLIFISAIVIDIGRVSIEKAKMQNAIDATALAAAHDMPDTSKATLTANQYIQANGFSTSDITISFSESNNVINIDGTKEINYTLARVIGFSDITIYAEASAKKAGSLGQAFNYSIFSGNTYPGGFSVRLQNVLTITGSNNVINGSVHGNYNIDLSGTTTTISGDCEAVGTVNSGGGTGIQHRVSGAPFIPMPDFSSAVAVIKSQAQDAGKYYTGNFSSANCGSNLTLTQPVYVEGNANLSGITISGAGCIYAKGKITITGTGTTYASNSNICMYSGYTSSNKSDAAISFGGSDKNFKGIIYAPNGSISVTGSNYTFSGNIIGKVVDLSGSAKTFTAADVSDSFPYINSSVTLIK